MAFVHGR